MTDLFLEDNTETDITPAIPTSLERQIRKLTSDAVAQQKRTWSYYQNLKATKPTQYWKPETQTQLQNDAEALGDAFANGDFHD